MVQSMRMTRRKFLKSGTALAGAALSTRVIAAAPAAEAVTPALIDAAKKEGKVVWYTSIDLSVAEKMARSFEARYSGIAVRVERSGAERVFQRIGQEYGSNIHAVDVVNSSDAAHLIVWKRDGLLEPYVPEDVAKLYPAEHAFMRDEGPRYDPECTDLAFADMLHLFRSTFGESSGIAA